MCDIGEHFKDAGLTEHGLHLFFQIVLVCYILNHAALVLW